MLPEINQCGNEHLRLCIACRQKQPQNHLLRLTVDNNDGLVYLVDKKSSGEGRLDSPATNVISLKARGRSAYLCRDTNCLGQALKGVRLKQALAGRQAKTHKLKRINRIVRWPLEVQLIKLLTTKCTEAEKTCQNTQGKEDLE